MYRIIRILAIAATLVMLIIYAETKDITYLLWAMFAAIVENNAIIREKLLGF